jgi:Lon protease-like protein
MEPEVLPLFPLPKTVLFPGTEITLYIFEPRYKEMIRRCLAEEIPFGILLLPRPASGNEEARAASRVGGAGKVIAHKVVAEGGEMLIQVRGIHRFRVREHVFEESYLQGKVEYLSPGAMGADASRALWEALRGDLDKVITLHPSGLSRIVEEMGDERDPGLLADRIVSHLPLHPRRKQQFLEIVDAGERAKKVCEILRREGTHLAILDALATGEPEGFQQN